jgi:PAS domain S-box-containing protein
MFPNLDHIFAAVADGVVALDSELRYVFINDAAERLVGVPREVALGRTPMELFPPDVTAEILPKILAAIRSGESTQYEAYYPGGERWFENRLYPTRGGVTILFTDITERKRIEEALRRSDEGHRFLVSLNDAVRSTRDPDAVMWAVATRAGQHFRVSRCTYGEIDSAQAHVVVARDYVDGVASLAGRHRLNDFGAELIAELKAGRTVTVPDVRSDPRTSSATAAFDGIETRSLICVPLVKEERFVAIFVLHHLEPRAWTPHDVALAEQVAERTWFAVESARAEAALRESRDVLSLAMRGGRMGAWSRNMLTNDVWWSRELEEIFGLPPGGFEGNHRGFRAFVHPDDAATVEAVVSSAVAARTDYVMEFRFRHASGDYRWMEGRGRGIYGADGTPRWLHGIGIDVTERKAAEQANRLLVRLDDAVRALADADEITQTAARMLGGHLAVNRCAYATVEADEDTFELSGNYTSGTHSIVGRYRFRQFGEACLRLMRAGEPYVVVDSRADDRITPGDLAAYERTAIRAVVCVPIHKAGRFVAAMAVHTVAPRPWSPAEIELVQRVANRCWESLERARVQRERAELLAAAEAANRAKDEFLAMLGHELRNPLAPILTALQLMRLRGEDASMRERVVIERQITHLTRLVDDLLDVARIARGKVELKLEALEIADVVARAIEVASPVLEQRTQTLEIDVPDRGLVVEGDAARLTQVLANLLNNAAKYTPPGGHITIAAAAAGRDVEVRVRDNGLGIAPAALPRVFDLFVQGGQALDRAEGGLGLGLTIVRSLTERHGGSVTAHSEGAGRGSEFVVRLPLTQRPVTAAGPAPAEAAVEAAPPAGARVLIVDDNVDAAEMLAHVLTIKGHQTWVAHDGPSALRVAEEAQPDAALLDIGLPVMDGYELAGRLRESAGGRGIRLVAVTGYGQPADRLRSAAAGFHHHLVKPIDLDEVVAVLERRGDGESSAS